MSSEALVLQSSPIITVGYVMQVLISLLIVVAFIYVIAKYLLPRMRVTSPGNLIQVTDRVMLEPQVTAYVLKVRKSSWLVVTSSKSVTRIDRLEDEIETR